MREDVKQNEMPGIMLCSELQYLHTTQCDHCGGQNSMCNNSMHIYCT
jgi:hypothetical protein